jgi:ATP-dependent protease ClpP protease subunit
MVFSIKQNTLTAYGIIWEGNGMEFVSALSQLEGQFTEITIKLHTYGGSVFDGNLMANAIRNSKSDITIEIVGIAASMGFVMSLYAKKVYMVENGFMMAHAPSGRTDGSALDHENNAKLLRSIEKNFVKLLTEKTAKPESYVNKWLTGDNWLDANQALDEGLIIGIIQPETITNNFDPNQLGITESYNQFSALLLNDSQIKLHTMKKAIIAALALTGVDEQSSDTATIDAVKQHFEAKISKVEADLKIAQQKAVDAESKLADQNKSAITAVIETAKKEGKITAEQVPTYEGIAKTAGVEALNTVLAAIPARTTITGQFSASGKTVGPVGREDWDFDKWQKEDPKGFEALAKETPEKFQELLNQKYKK